MPDTVPAQRRRFQFSLSAIFVMLTLVAIALGGLAHLRRIRSERAELKALIVARGGAVRSMPSGIKRFGWAVDGPAKPMLPLGNWRRSVFDYVGEIDAPNSLSEAEKARIRVLFPDATLFRKVAPPLRAATPPQ
jgi:hypothetical protein